MQSDNHFKGDVMTMSHPDRFTFIGGSRSVDRVGYGAMQLAGPHVWGPPADVDGAIAVLREAIALGVDHIDTSDFYGPHVTNQIIKRALHPYPDDLVIVTKIGFRRGDDESWNIDSSPEALTSAVHDNLRNLGLDAIDIVNLRMPDAKGPGATDLERSLTALADLKRKGLIKAIGLSNVTAEHYAKGKAITEIVCVQNQYNLAYRKDDTLIDTLAKDGVAYVSFFPLGGFTPLQSSTLDDIAKSLAATSMQVALAWLLQRSPNILPIPGTKSIEHLRQNMDAQKLQLSADVIAKLDTIAQGT
jgi:pyridoxine 4-dehydrogenase